MPETKPAGRRRMIWLVIVLLAIELVGIVGLITVLNGGLEQVAPIAVCAALIMVPILFGIALRSELRGKTGRPPGANTPP